MSALNTSFLSITLIATALILSWLAAFAWRHRDIPVAFPLALSLGISAIWTFVSGLEISSYDLGIRVFLMKIWFSFISFLAVTVFLTAIQHVRLGHWITKRILILLLIVPVINVLMIWTDQWHSFLYTNYSIEIIGQLPVLKLSRGQWYWIYIYFSYLIYAGFFVVLIRSLKKSRPLVRQQTILIILSSILPLGTDLLYQFDITYPPGYNLTPNAMLGTGIILTWALFSYRLFGIIPRARSTLVQNMSDGVIVLDRNNNIVEINESTEMLIGKSQIDVFGENIKDILKTLAHFLEQFHDANIIQTEILVESTTRGPIYLDIRVSPLKSHTSQDTGRLVVLRDITEQKNNERKLMMQSAALESAANAIVITDTKGNITWANSAFGRMTGYTEEEVIGKNIRILKSGMHDNAFYLDLWNTILSGKIWHGEISNLHKNGNLFYEEMTIAPVRDKKGEIIQFVAIKEDITERKITEDKLRRQNAYLEALRETTINLVSHLDLNSLLETIVRRAGELMGTSNAFLDLVEPDTFELLPRVGLGLMEEALNHKVKSGEGLAGQVWQTGEPLIIEDYDAWEGRIQGFKIGIIRSIIGVPLKTQNTVIGVLGIAYQHEIKRKFDQEDVLLLTQFAQLAAIAIENARLFEVERIARQQAETLQTAIHALSSTLNLQEVLHLILSELQKVVSYDSSSIFQIIGDNLELIAGRGFEHPENLIGIKFNINDENTPSSIVIHSRKPYILPDVIEKYNDFNSTIHSKSQIRGWLGVPLLFGDELIGMLTLDKFEPNFYKENHARIAVAFASQAAIAINNARLYATTIEALTREQRFNEIARILSSTLELPQILTNLVRLATEVVGGQAGSIGLISSDQMAIHYKYVYNIDETLKPSPKTRGEGLAWAIIESGEPIILENYYDHPASIPDWSFLNARAYLGVPIMAGEESIGTLGIFSTSTEKKFNELDLAIIIAIGQQAGIAIQNARRFDQERARRHRQTVLLRLSTSLATTVDEDKVWQAVVESLEDKTLTYEQIRAYEWEKISGDRVLRSQVGNIIDQLGQRIPQGKGLSWLPLVDGEPHYTPFVRDRYDYIPGLNKGAEADIPIRIGHDIVGVLSIENSIPYSFSPEDLELFNAAANQVGLALGRSRLLKETRQRLNELDTINTISQASATQLELKALLDMVGENIRQIFKAEAVYIALYDQEMATLHVPYWTYYDQRLENQVHPYGKGLASQIINSRKPLVINQDYYSRSSELGAIWVVGEMYNDFPKSWLGVPILARDEVIGVISTQNFTRENAFNEDDVRLLTTIAANVGIAIQNAQLYSELQQELSERKRAEEQLLYTNEKLQDQLAKNEALRAQLREQVIRDPLTGLFNRRYLDETLEREIARALRENYPISMVMIDIDNFKKFNDNYGHRAGDQLLQMLSVLLSTNSRQEDIACRYGGEEFLIVLPNTSQEIAYKRSEQWRRSFEHNTILENGREYNSTLSIGIATFPEHGDTADAVITRADQALYQSKQRGKNQTIIYSESTFIEQS